MATILADPQVFVDGDVTLVLRVGSQIVRVRTTRFLLRRANFTSISKGTTFEDELLRDFALETVYENDLVVSQTYLDEGPRPGVSFWDMLEEA